jgi:hypothetical protein
MEKFKMLPILNCRITFYQDLRNIGLSLTIGGENKLMDNDLLLHIQVLFWMVEITYSKKERSDMENGIIINGKKYELVYDEIGFSCPSCALYRNLCYNTKGDNICRIVFHTQNKHFKLKTK